MQCCVLIDACRIRDHPLRTTAKRAYGGHCQRPARVQSVSSLGRIMPTLHVCSGVFPVRGRDGSDGRARGKSTSSPSRLWFRVRLQTRRVPCPWADTRSCYPREARFCAESSPLQSPKVRNNTLPRRPPEKGSSIPGEPDPHRHPITRDRRPGQSLFVIRTPWLGQSTSPALFWG